MGDRHTPTHEHTHRPDPVERRQRDDDEHYDDVDDDVHAAWVRVREKILIDPNANLGPAPHRERARRPPHARRGLHTETHDVRPTPD